KKAQISGETSTTIIGKDPTRLHLVSRIVEGLEFNLTSAQKRALNEIVSDLRRPFPMHRLVQGDVGCGKTMVALLASAHVVESGLQVSLMVPTEILAEQHFKTFRRILEPLGVQVGLLLGKMKVSEKAEIYSQISSGTIQILIGTQALIQTGVSFNKLGLVIVDEQHRFGVIQRSNLKQKGGSPHFLVMTATPIPRSLAMTVYGDLDVSVIDELPKGRQAVLTRVTDESKRNLVWNFVEKQVLAGRQAYIVYPLVEESEKLDLQNAQSGFENLKKRFPQLNVGLLHGKMKAEFKEQVMSRFRDGEIQVLVATSVVEVGVDVPNANIIIVEHAERFGLSQLHQLRGRVGRGLHKSYCVLVLGRAVSRESRQRIGVLEQTTDGFRVAEEDLRIRGSGEIFGTRQSGLSGFRLAQLGRDQIILEQAREAAFKLIAMDPHLERSDHQRLKRVWETKKTQTLG
ncbi:MAG: ATP-dependent DNA helicase RecG, partial [Bdellovibrionales bacterium]|nr:ATP-dependent DNA helicase RecG [Bdellovibrionales bacterium]